MTLKNHLLKMLDSEIWANQLLFQTIEKVKDPDERSVLLFSHITSSYNAWLSRIQATEITVTLFQERTVAESKQVLQHTLGELKKYLANADDNEVSRIIHFTFPFRWKPAKNFGG